jgi:membrane protein YqaA with SNARE-associated domain
MILAFQAGDWAILTVAVIVIASVLGGMVKFWQAIKVLRKGPPSIDPELAAEQEQQFQNNEQND